MIFSLYVFFSLFLSLKATTEKKAKQRKKKKEQSFFLLSRPACSSLSPPSHSLMTRGGGRGTDEARDNRNNNNSDREDECVDLLFRFFDSIFRRWMIALLFFALISSSLSRLLSLCVYILQQAQRRQRYGTASRYRHGKCRGGECRVYASTRERAREKSLRLIRRSQSFFFRRRRRRRRTTSTSTSTTTTRTLSSFFLFFPSSTLFFSQITKNQ